jgi:hypothetical protein
MLPKSICFVLAGLLVVVPLWILMSYGITADGRPNSPKILIGMTFCFVVGVFWLYEDLKDLLRTRWAAISKADALHRSTCCARAARSRENWKCSIDRLRPSLRVIERRFPLTKPDVHSTNALSASSANTA